MGLHRFERRGVRLPVPADRVAWAWSIAPEFREQAVALDVHDNRAARLGIDKKDATDEVAISLHAFGIIAEWAARKALGLPVDDWKPDRGAWKNRPDIGYEIDVRSVSVSHYGLWVRLGEKPQRRSVLVLLHEIPQLRPPKDGIYKAGWAWVVGWIGVGEALSHPEWIMDANLKRDPQVCVPQWALRDLDTLELNPEPALYESEPDDMPNPGDEDWTPPGWFHRSRDGDPGVPQRPRLVDTLDALIPEAYRGQTWPLTPGGVESRFPPMRDDPQGPVTPTFIDFQDHQHALKRAQHPEYYCVECHGVYVTSICPHCKSARVRPTKAPRTEQGTPYRCDACGKPSFQALVCGPCREALGEQFGGQLRLPEALVRARTGKRRKPKELESERFLD